ncbi:tetratricopeptide repeat protein [Kribbella voronezhensis]|uniref:Tetratricopeptide repeat protein n=1 Tax=Kribbella voronezhensis TaxID=2512212 RepID=A0A4R7TGI5_9ACTN|nr:XRE family transcriptional regulator [Kribbella voronezhensis]TDU91324.1 tetratricopeptide repeat protein [Kribbella voronezhensis]
MEFASLLTRHRRTAGLTQEMLAERARMSAQAVSALERGIRQFPRRATVTALADALHLPPQARDTFIAAATRPRSPRPADPGPAPSTPYQLPTPLADFTGREAELGQLIEILSADGIVAAAVVGMGGVGKTALALRAAHSLLDRFPDGQLYLNLHSHGSGDPMSQADALTYLLRGLGLPPDEVPRDPDLAAGRLRTILAERRVLLVLDDAQSAEQIQRMLPGTGGSGVIITSRREFAGVAFPVLRLAVLPPADGLELLRRIASADRVDPDPVAAEAVLDACGYLPLAIRIAAGRLVTRPAWPLAHLADLLADERHRLDQLSRTDHGVRASFALSMRQLVRSTNPLETQAAEIFDQLGIAQLDEFSADLVSRLIDLPQRRTGTVLEQLCDLHLLEATAPGRYRLHDLLRTYARERAVDRYGQAEQAAALTRMVDLCAAVAWHCVELAHPNAGRATWFDPRPTDKKWLPAPDDLTSTLAWLDRERSQLVALTLQASSTPGVPGRSVLRLAIGLVAFYITRGHWLDWRKVIEAAVTVAITEGDREAEAILRNDLGLVLSDVALYGTGDYSDSLAELEQGLKWFEQLGNLPGIAMALANLSHVLEQAGDHEKAIGFADRALDCYTELDDPVGQATALINLGQLHGNLGHRVQERDCFDRSIALSTKYGHQRALSIALLRSGITYLEAGHPEPAVAELQRCVEGFESLGNQVGLAEGLVELGRAHEALGDPETAIEHYTDAYEIARYYDDGVRREAALSRLRELGSPLVEAAGGDRTGGEVDDGSVELARPTDP